MTKSATIRARIRPDIKEKAERVFERLGLSTTQALTLFYRQVALRRGLPFEIVIPNAATRRTFEATEAGTDLVVCRDAADMFKRLGI